MDVQALTRDIQERKTKRAQEASVEEKMLDGPRLFKMSCEAVKAGLRIDHPNATEEEIHKLLIKRVYKKWNMVKMF